jgi:hypothetical protein
MSMGKCFQINPIYFCFPPIHASPFMPSLSSAHSANIPKAVRATVKNAHWAPTTMMPVPIQPNIFLAPIAPKGNTKTVLVNRNVLIVVLENSIHERDGPMKVLVVHATPVWKEAPVSIVVVDWVPMETNTPIPLGFVTNAPKADTKTRVDCTTLNAHNALKVKLLFPPVAMH